ncbi:MAG: TIGR02281 family clan AA aspartic protease [Neomegalonema sp.]|nr:TIGR02281 family clan AA aspartic protease [Neomegalonema sp.]
MLVILKFAAAGFGSLVAYILAARYGWAIQTPAGVASLTFVATLAGLFAIREKSQTTSDRLRVTRRRIMESSSLARRPQHIGFFRRSFVGVVAWAILVGGMALAYDQRAALRSGALQFLSALQPGRAVALNKGEAVLTRGVGGHFTAIVSINDRMFRMLVDTGSTDVALPYREARRLGIDLHKLAFKHEVTTANGPARVALVTLPVMKVGPIELRNVRASVAEPGRLAGALLGMSFLGRLSEVTFSGDQLRLRR